MRAYWGMQHRTPDRSARRRPAESTEALVLDDGAILTRRETSEKTRLSIETLKRYERSGRLTPLRIGPKLVRYRVADVLALLK